MTFCGALLPLLLVLPPVFTAGEETNWSRFRGPEGAGRADSIELPESLSEESFLWRVELAGRGHSSPVAWGELIFLTAEDQESGARFVLAHSAADGSELWRIEDLFEPHGQHDLNSFASTTPTCDAERVVVVWTSGTSLRARALSHAGEDLWERELGSWSAGHGSGSSAVLVDGVLIVAADHEAEGSFLAGFDPGSGEPLWRRERKSSRASFATPTTRALPGGGHEVLFASTSHGITSLDPKSGELRWETGALFRQRCVGSPVVAGPVVFASAGSGGRRQGVGRRQPRAPRGWQPRRAVESSPLLALRADAGLRWPAPVPARGWGHPDGRGSAQRRDPVERAHRRQLLRLPDPGRRPACGPSTARGSCTSSRPDRSSKRAPSWIWARPPRPLRRWSESA